MVSEKRSNSSSSRRSGSKHQHQSELVPLTTQVSLFDEKASKYRCCCGCMNVQVGTILIGIFVTLLLLFANAGSVAYLSIVEGYNLVFIGVGAFIANIIPVVVLICLFIGAAKRYRYLLLPFLVVNAIEIVVGIVGTFMAIIYVCGIDPQDSCSKYKLCGWPDYAIYILYALMVILLCIVPTIICIWWEIIVIKCFRYFHDLLQSCTYDVTFDDD